MNPVKKGRPLGGARVNYFWKENYRGGIFFGKGRKTGRRRGENLQGEKGKAKLSDASTEDPAGDRIMVKKTSNLFW